MLLHSKKTTIKLLESLVNSDKVIYMTAAQEKQWAKEAFGIYYNTDNLVGDCYFKVVNVLIGYSNGLKDKNNTWVILHPYYIENNEIVAAFSENDMLNDEYAYL